MMSVDDEWTQYLKSASLNAFNEPCVKPVKIVDDVVTVSSKACFNIPKCEELHISTKTKVLFLNQEIDIHNIFWKIPVIEYWKPIAGVVKKQIKVVCNSEEECDEYRKKLVDIPYYREHIIKQVNINSNSRRTKFKDERKITIGMSKKDIMNCRSKVKNAFYNCFAVIFRFNYEGTFREIHVKVFNTGKMEIPGILNVKMLEASKQIILDLLQPFVETKLSFVEKNAKEESVLINSNFNCGFCINREKLHHIIHTKYGIETSYDPCTYPGVKCKFYFNNELECTPEFQTGIANREDGAMKMNELTNNEKYTIVSFMVFRTGSCLIVGNCTEQMLFFVFDFLKNVLMVEYSQICMFNDNVAMKQKKMKIRKRNVKMSNDYLQKIGLFDEDGDCESTL